MRDPVSFLYENGEVTASDHVDVPAWIESDITAYTVAAIVEGSCESGAYMPAVTYHSANETMSKHGDDVLQYIEDNVGELPPIPEGASWSGIAVHFLAYAVDLWASSVHEELADAIEAETEG